MCEFCGRGETKIRRLKRDEVEPDDVCEWMPEPEELEEPSEFEDFEETLLSAKCSQPPRWLVQLSDVSEHLCPEHAAQETRELDDGLSDFLSAAGLDPGELRPIKEAQDCDHFDPIHPADCPERAKYARWVIHEFFLCDEHVREHRVH